MGQCDIESVRRVSDEVQPGGFERREVLVTFFDMKKRDAVVSGSINLGSYIDPAGKPTAGIRLEIQRKLDDSWRLLSRFGTRLRLNAT